MQMLGIKAFIQTQQILLYKSMFYNGDFVLLSFRMINRKTVSNYLQASGLQRY